VTVETRNPDVASRSLGWVLRIVDAGPRPFYRAAVASFALTCVLALPVAAFIRPPGALPAPQRDMILVALAGLCLSVVLGAASVLRGRRPRPAWPDRFAAPRDRAAIWLALAAWFPFLLLVAYYRATATLPPTVQWINFGFQDKRWVTATYLLGVLAPMLWLLLAARVLTVAQSQPPTWREWAVRLFPRAVAAAPERDWPRRARPERSRASRILTAAAGLVTALGLSWYFLGPPWHLTQTRSVISTQEDVYLVGFQAIAHGHLPYIGVAGVQYGPGTQLLSYLLMRHVTSFSVVGFRETWALYQWAGAAILFAVFFLAFGYARGLAVVLLSELIYPALHVVGFQSANPSNGYWPLSFDGGGAWAWANPLRYVGAIAVVVLLPAVIKRAPSRSAAVAGIGLGALWGVMSYMGQENLPAGAVGALVIAALLLLSGTCSWRAAWTALVTVLAGFLLAWVPILAFYAVHGDLGQFLNLYTLSPRSVPEGYSDTAWQGASHLPSPLTTMYYALPFLLAVLALLTVFEFRPLRIATQWTRQRVLLAVALVVTILLYQGALLRADTSHLTGTLLLVPALVIMVATLLPRLTGLQRNAAIGVGVLLFLVSLPLLPYKSYMPGSVYAAAMTPYRDRQYLAAAPKPPAPANLAAQRVGAGLDLAPECCQGSDVSMTDFIRLMNRIHAIVGDRTTYVADVPHTYPGLVYFTADLNPAPVQFDKYTTILNEPQLNAYMMYFRAHVLPVTQAVITAQLSTPEARYFLQRYPDARRITLHYGNVPYYILLRQG
jgi:hypothetical protein